MDEVRAITVHSQSNIDTPGFLVMPTGLMINGVPSFAEWALCGKQLSLAGKAINWAIGDWLNYGEITYQEAYAQGLDEEQFQYQTIANVKYVSSKIPFYRRREKLTYSHHTEVASLTTDEQDRWLDLAERKGMTRQELRQAIRASKHAQREVRPEIAKLSSASVRLIVSHAEDMPEVESESVDLIITSPPYNLGSGMWPMGGEGREARDDGIGYSDVMQENAYQAWQVDCLIEMYRVAKSGASLFYNHKVRNVRGEIAHPMDWLRDEHNPWIVRQEIVWDRGSTHNHSETLFWPEDERIYWMTKGKPALPERPIGMSNIWRFHGPVAGTWHPAPFGEQDTTWHGGISGLQGVGRVSHVHRGDPVQ